MDNFVRITIILTLIISSWADSNKTDNSILTENKGVLLDEGGELIIRINIPYQTFILENIEILMTTATNSLPNWYKEHSYEEWWSDSIYQPMKEKYEDTPSITIKHKIFNLDNPSVRHTYLTIRKNILKFLTFMKTTIAYLDTFNLIDGEHKRILNIFNKLNSTINEEDYNSKYFREKLNRSKRGLLNVIGSGLKFVFGVATERDVKNLNDKMRKSNLKIHLSQYKITAMTSKVNELIRFTSKSIKIIQDNLDQINDLQALTSYLNQYHTVWTSLATEAEFMYINSIILEQKINILKRGIIIPDILRIDELEKLIAEGHKEFPDFIFPIKSITKQNFPKYLDIVTLTPTESNYKYLLKIPFVRPTEYDLYELHPFPTFTINNIPVIPIVKKFVAKAVDRELYKVYSTIEKLKTYTHDNKTYFLDERTSYDISNLNLCEVKIMKKVEQPKILEFCNYDNIQLSGGIYSINLNGWYIYFQSKTSANIKCGLHEVFEELSYYNYFPQDCTIKTKFHTFRAKINQHFTSLNNTGFQPKIINYVLPEMNSSKHHELFRIKDNVTLLKTYNEDINDMNTQYQFNMIHTMSNSVVIIIVFSVLTISLIIVTCKIKNKRSRNNPINRNFENVSMHSI